MTTTRTIEASFEIIAAQGWTFRIRGLCYGTPTIEIAKPGHGAIRILGSDSEQVLLDRAVDELLASKISWF